MRQTTNNKSPAPDVLCIPGRIAPQSGHSVANVGKINTTFMSHLLCAHYVRTRGPRVTSRVPGERVNVNQQMTRTAGGIDLTVAQSQPHHHPRHKVMSDCIRFGPHLSLFSVIGRTN